MRSIRTTTTIIMPDFILFALIAGVGVATVMGATGVFVVWRRMAYFGASVAHTALLGVALGLFLAIDLIVGIAITCVAFSLAIVLMQQKTDLTSDTLLGILAHAALALGIVTLAILEGVRLDLLGYLFGDILAVSRTDLMWIYGGGALCLGILAAIWRPLLAMTVHEELARAEGLPTLAVQLVFTLLLAIVIAVSLKIVGAMLIVSLLIIPAATARPFARSPEMMAMLAAAFGVVSVAGGLYASVTWDTPSGPSIVVVSSALFLVSLAARRSAGG